MYLPHDLFALPYKQLVASRHASSPPVLLLVALEPDALCACRILTAILKRDCVAHNIVPVAGYGDLEKAGLQHVQPMRAQNGGSGGTVICLGTGGLVDLVGILGLEGNTQEEDSMGGVDIWVIDARRPWNLGNVFGGRPFDPSALSEISGNARKKMPELERGKIRHSFRSGRGGVIVFDDGDIDQLEKERDAYFELEQMPDVEDDGMESDGSESGSEDGDDHSPRLGQKRKSWSGADSEDEDEEGDRPRQRRRSNSQESIPVTPTRDRQFNSSDTLVPNSQASPAHSTSTIAPPSGQDGGDRPVSMRRQRRRFLREKRGHEAVLHAYYSKGSSYSEPISSMLYRLASELGRADNDSLWLACVGVSSIEHYGRNSTGQGLSQGISGKLMSSRDEPILSVLRDEVHRLNPPDASTNGHYGSSDIALPTHARSPNDMSIRLSPEPRLLLLRHWSLYESMLHSPYLAARLHLWSEPGKKRLHKLLAKMGVSLVNAKQGYVHMDVEAKRSLRSKLLKYAPLYGLEDLVPPSGGREGWGFVRSWGWKACLSAGDVAAITGAILEVGKTGMKRAKRGTDADSGLVDVEGRLESEEYVQRFWDAFDALGNVANLLESRPLTISLYRAILRTGTSLISKRQIRHLRAFRMAVVKEGPDVTLFTHPGALTKLALWLAEAISEQEKSSDRHGKDPTPLVLAGLNEARGVYTVVGTGGGGGVVDLEERKQRKEQIMEKKKKRDEKKKAAELKKMEREAAREARRLKRGEDDDDDEIETESEGSSSESEDEDEEGLELPKQRNNRFGVAFQEVVEEVGVTTRIDNFENCVIEVKKDDLQSFLEALSMKAVVG